MIQAHTDREYDAELKQLKENILSMGATVEDMISTSMRALVEHQPALATEVVQLDHQVNRLEMESDDLCMRILARRQPVASDLRFITSALKLVTDLERIGDLAVNIGERVLELDELAPLKPYFDLPRMAEAASSMVHQALDAFVRADAGRAQEVIEQDRVVDAYYAQIFRELLDCMVRDPHCVFYATRLQSIAKYLERVGDHATNLAEMVVFMVMREDIRHRGKLGEPSEPTPVRGVLFLCVRNSARSQIAEGWARELLPVGTRVFSAGSDPAEAVNPWAVDVMREAGVDIGSQRPKGIGEIPLAEIDLVVSLCAEEVCPVLPGSMLRERWNLPDPVQASGGEQGIKTAFRATRDEIRERMEVLAKQWT